MSAGQKPADFSPQQVAGLHRLILVISMKKSRFFTIFLGILVAFSALTFTVTAQEFTGFLNFVKVEVSCDQFRAQKYVTKSVKLNVHGRLKVELCSNPSTGYQWSDSAQISDHTVLWQTSHTTLPASSGALGAPGKEGWTFQALHEGKTIISLEYGRPWEGTGADNWSLKLNVTVVSRQGEKSQPSHQIGEELVREVFQAIHDSNIAKLENMISKDFQAVHDFGASNRQEEIQTLKGIKLGEYTLDNFKVTRQGDVLIVTYTIAAEETIQGEQVPQKPIPRLSIFIKTNSEWKWLAHANLS